MDKKWYETKKHKMAEKAAEDLYKIALAVWDSQGTLPTDPTPKMKKPLLVIKDYVVEKNNIYKDLNYLSPDSISITMNDFRSIVWRWFKPAEITPEERELILLGGHDKVENSLRQMARIILLGQSEGFISSEFFSSFLTKEQANELIQYVYEEWEYFRENNPELYEDFSIDFNKRSFFVWISTLAPLTEETMVKYREHLNIELIENNSNVDRTPSVELLIDRIHRE